MPITRPMSRIRAERAMHGMTQAALARAVGVSPATMSAVENGDRTPDSDLVRRLAVALDCRPERLVSHDTASCSTEA